MRPTGVRWSICFATALARASRRSACRCAGRLQAGSAGGRRPHCSPAPAALGSAAPENFRARDSGVPALRRSDAPDRRPHRRGERRGNPPSPRPSRHAAGCGSGARPTAGRALRARHVFVIAELIASATSDRRALVSAGTPQFGRGKASESRSGASALLDQPKVEASIDAEGTERALMRPVRRAAASDPGRGRYVKGGRVSVAQQRSAR